MARRRSVDEIRELLEGYRASGMTQIAYCRQTGVALSSLGRYLRRGGGKGQRLIRVRLVNQVMIAAYTVQGDSFVPAKPQLWS